MPDLEQFRWFFREMGASRTFHVQMAVGVGSLVALFIILAASRKGHPAMATAATWLWAGGTIAALYLLPLAESPRREMVAAGVVIVAAGLLSAVWRRPRMGTPG